MELGIYTFVETPPGPHETLGERFSAVLTGRFAPVAARLPEAPTHWNEFFTRAFSMDPAERPRSAKAFQSELEHTLAHGSVGRHAV